MPELAEAGYTSLWLPPPTKGSGGLSVGYDLWDRFDLGSKDQRGSVRTRYGTEAELLEMVETAHRFGIRVYFDNIMNHNAFDIPGYNADTPIDIYPGMVPEDFHLRVTEEGFYRKWDNTRNWGDTWQVQNLGLADLVDIAQEPGDINQNFGPSEGSTFKKIKFVRQPNNPEYYCYLPNGTYVGFGPNNGITTGLILSNQSYYAERVEDFLNRAARWLIDRTKADGLRLDAVKHIRADFFGATYGAGKDFDDYGYLGQAQRQFNLTRGYSDGNHRDTVFDTEKPRDDAMMFGEHLGEPPGYGPYFDSGMRLVDNVLRNSLNDRLGNPSSNLNGLDVSGGGGFAADLAVMHAQSHDNDYAARRELQHAMYFTRAGLGLLYTDGNYHAETLGESGGAFPRHANTSFLGQWNDPRVPNLLKIHDNFARGYQKAIWADADYLAYERIDKRENGSMPDKDGVTMLIMLCDNYANGQSRNIVPNISFPKTPFVDDAYLVNYSTYGGEFYKYASELGGVTAPQGGYFVFSWRNPRESLLWQPAGGKPITILQGTQEVSTVSYVRKDGPDGDPAFNPYGVPDANQTDFAYTYSVPRITNGSNLTFIARADGSAENILLRLDGGVDLNGIRTPTNTNIGLPNLDPVNRDNPPAVSWDIFLGYEQAWFRQRIFPEMFAAAVTGSRNAIGSGGAETYTVAGVLNSAVATNYVTGDTTAFVYHQPTAAVAGSSTNQYSNNQLWAKTNSGLGAGYRAFLYYSDNTGYPEGAGGQGYSNTKVVELSYQFDADGGSWWRTDTLPDDFTANSRYKIGVAKTAGASVYPDGAANVEKLRRMLTTFAISNFNAATIEYKPHNDYGHSSTGLAEGFHVIRMRPFLKRDFPTRAASIYNTFTQTFYYDTKRPEGEIMFPANNGDTVGGQEYGVVVRTDPSITEVWYRVEDVDASNDDATTKRNNGNGTGFEPFTDSNNNGQYDSGEPFSDLNGNTTWDNTGVEAWAKATEVTATPAITSPYPREWRFNYANIAAGNSNAVIKVRLREISSAERTNVTAWSPGNDTTGHYTTLLRNVNAAGIDSRLFIAFPQNDGDTIGNPYVMKAYFSKALADGYSTQDLINQFLIRIQSTTSGSTDNGVAQDRASYSIVYNETAEFHALAFPLPNLYNDVADFLHGIEVTMERPGGVTLRATRLVKAYPAPAAPFISIIQPVAVDSDGQPYLIILPDVPNPTPEQRQYTIRVQTGTAGTNVVVIMDSAPPAYTNFLDGISLTNVFTEGSSQYWDFLWKNLVPGSYTFTATVTTTNGATASAQRNATVAFREVVDTNPNDADDDDDGLLDGDESTATPLPATTSDNWNNGQVHAYYIYGKSYPQSPDSDGDGLPDGLELGWRVPITNDTNQATDSNGDGYPNFIADLDPPFYNTLDNYGKVPGVNSLSEGGDRAKQLAGSLTNPLNPDSDGDGIPDGVEDRNRNGWTDGDGASIDPTWDPWLGRSWPNGKIDGGETWLETSPVLSDSDADGLSDGYGEDKNFNGFIDGDTNSNRTWQAGELWTETDPLNRDTDGDGLPDGWEVQYNFDPLDNGTLSYRTGNTGDPVNGATGDPDADSLTNLDEFTNGTNPRVPDTGTPPPADTIVIGPVTNPVVIGTVTNLGEFTDWKLDDLIVLDEYDGDGFNNQSTDLYRAWDGFDSSRDLVAFYARDGGAPGLGGDGKFYFRVDIHELKALAEDGYLDIYVVIDTGNPGAGEYNLPDSVDTGTEMRWEAVVAVYGRNNGRVYLDLDRNNNSTAIGQVLTSFGVTARDQNTADGFLQAYFNSTLDAVEFSISRQALLDAGWNGLNPSQLNFQVFTTKDGTGNSPIGPGDLGGRSDIRDAIYDDWIASDYWRDQVNISGNKSVLKTWFGKNASNDRGKRAKLVSLIHGNQTIQPGSQTHPLINTGAGAGYYRPLDGHQAFAVPASMHITPTLASAIQWAKVNPAAGKPWRDGPALNARISALAASNHVALFQTTFSDHILPYFSKAYNSNSVALARDFLQATYGITPDPNVLWTPERVVDHDVLDKVLDLGASYTFVDQMRHIWKWFGRTSALGNDGYRLNRINGVKCFVVNDQASTYRFQNEDGGLNLPLRALFSRKARSGTQDQAVILFSSWDDFLSKPNSDAYDLNIRWIASRPWIQIVTPQQIAANEVDLSHPPDGIGDTWGWVERGTSPTLQKVAQDWIDHATQENYDHWYVGSALEESLNNKLFAIRPGVTNATTYGMQVIGTGLIGQSWNQINALASPATKLRQLGRGVLHASTFVTAFHNQTNNDLSKFSTGDYIYPDTTYQNLADFAKFAHSQSRFAAIYKRVDDWAIAANAGSYDGLTVKSSEDADLDGEPEYLLYNNRVFALFERIGGRLTGAWVRDPVSGSVYQTIGNFLSYSNSETEDEGAVSVLNSNVVAHRTSGFKDWWATGPNTSQYVNDLYTVNDGGATGWRLRSSDNKITKFITLAPDSNQLEARYELTGDVTKLYVRHGLSPDLLNLLMRGQESLTGPNLAAGKVTLANSNAFATVVTALALSDTGAHSNTLWTTSATDNGGITNLFDTVAMRNQAQTHQVELESTGLHFSFALELTASDCDADPDGDGLNNCQEATLGTNPNHPDTDGDGMNDGWEALYRDPVNAGNPNADDDADGATDLEESVAGTNPDSAVSFLRILSIVPVMDTYQITWTSEPGKQYEIWTTTDLTQPFTCLPACPVIDSAGTQTSYTAGSTSDPRRFFKVRVRP
jgi:hypothetical protein